VDDYSDYSDAYMIDEEGVIKKKTMKIDLTQKQKLSKDNNYENE
jgi:hypothetical protein